MSMTGDYGTGLNLNFLQGLIPNLLGRGASLDQNQDVLNLQENQLGNAADLIQLLFDPAFAMLTGTADPLVYAGQQGGAATFPATPTIDRYAMSGVPVVSLVANGIKSGEYDLLQAQGILREAIANGEIPGYTPEMTDAAVQSMWDEQTKAEADYAAALSGGGNGSSGGGDVYSDALLPSPLETYQPTVTGPYSVPTNEQFKGRYVQSANDLSAAQKALSEYEASVPRSYVSADRASQESLNQGQTVREPSTPQHLLSQNPPTAPYDPWNPPKSEPFNPRNPPEAVPFDPWNLPEPAPFDPWKVSQPEPNLAEKLSGRYKGPSVTLPDDAGTSEDTQPTVFDVIKSQLQGDIRMADYNQQVDDLTLRYLAQMKTNANQTPLTDTLRQRALKAQLMGIL